MTAIHSFAQVAPPAGTTPQHNPSGEGEDFAALWQTEDLLGDDVGETSVETPDGSPDQSDSDEDGIADLLPDTDTDTDDIAAIDVTPPIQVTKPVTLGDGAPSDAPVPQTTITPPAHRTLADRDVQPSKIMREGMSDTLNPVIDRQQTAAVAVRDITAATPPQPAPPLAGSGPVPPLSFLPVEAEEGRAREAELGLSQAATSTSVAAVRGATVHPMQPHAQQAAKQIATATVQSRAGSTEIALNPEELGRVRMSLTSTETGITVLIIAERPETADLMRRNIELLMREFREYGYDDASFTFGEQDSGSDQGGEHPTPDQSEPPPIDQSPSAPITTVALRGGLDLKL